MFKKTDLERWPDKVLAKMRKPTLEMFKKYWQVALNISAREDPMNDPAVAHYDCWGESNLNQDYGCASIYEGMRHRVTLEPHGFNRLIELGVCPTI